MARTITPKIDARLFTAQMNAKEKARCNIRQYIPIGAVKGNFWDDAPAPGMYTTPTSICGVRNRSNWRKWKLSRRTHSVS